MRRREFVKIAATVAAWPMAARAQQKAMPVIGYLNSGSRDPYPSPSVVGLYLGLGDTGYVEGQNVAIEYRWAEHRSDRLPALAADLVGRKVDVIATGGTPAALAAKHATSTIPIVIVVGDPIGEGLVTNLARPGGNLTGISILTELAPKRLELLSELVPQASVIALLVNPNNPNDEHMLRDVGKAAYMKGVQLDVVKINSQSEFESAFATLASSQAGALLVSADSLFIGGAQPARCAGGTLRHSNYVYVA
jgi:putative tryptophan/tyrosine transport system substrate-binding protein